VTAVAYTCPHCTATSQHPADAKHRYCGRCHRYADEGAYDDLDPGTVPAPRAPVFVDVVGDLSHWTAWKEFEDGHQAVDGEG